MLSLGGVGCGREHAGGSAPLCAERDLWKSVEKYLLCHFNRRRGRGEEEMTEGKKEGRQAPVIEAVRIRLTLLSR